MRSPRFTWIFLLPLILVIGLVSGVPFIKAVADSFYIDRYGIRDYVGWEQYAYVFSDSGIAVSLGVTLVWAIAGAVGSLFAGYAIARVMITTQASRKWLYGALLISWGLPVFVTAPVWRMVTGSGMPLSLDLYGAPFDAFVAALAANIWSSVSLSGIALYTAMRKTQTTLIESARLDGAETSTIFRHVYKPSARNTGLAVGLLIFLRGCKEFTLVYIMTGGGPPLRFGITGRSVVGSTTTLGVYVYEVFTESNDLGLSSAYAVAMALLILCIVLVWYAFFAHRGFGKSSWTQRVRVPSKGGSALGTIGTWSVAVLVFVATAAVVVILFRIAFTPFAFSNFSRALMVHKTGRNFFNTAVISLFVGSLTPLIAFSAAFYARLKTPSVSMVLIAVLQILGAATGIYSLVPLYTISLRFHVVDTFVPVVLASISQALPFSCLALIAFLKRVPESLFDEAKMTGANIFRTAKSIVFPLATPAVMLVVLFSTILAWNAFTPGLLLLHTEAKFPVSLKLFSLAGELGSSGNDWGVFGAVALLNVIILSVFLWLFRRKLSATGLSDMVM